jgi:hypothetical protein
MKNIVLIAGLLFLILNIVAGLLISSYNNFNDGLVAFAIISTTVVIYILFNIKKGDLTRMFLTFIFILTGFLKILFSLFSVSTFRNNYSILCILGLIFVEIIILLANYYNKKNIV